MKVLVFDTETTGVIPKLFLPIHKMPYIVQLAFVMYDTDTNTLISNFSFNELINIPSHVEIPEGASKVHNIYKNDCKSKGIPIQKAITSFATAYSKADIIVAHNIVFDNRMIMIECERYNIPCFITEEISLCSMKLTRNFCGIIAVNSKTGEKYIKNPKLEELHQKMFNWKPKFLHDALVDLMVCLRCFIKHAHQKDICDTNSDFAHYFSTLK
jgi:DNA polymerase III epsilon subunit-like protein